MRPLNARPPALRVAQRRGFEQGWALVEALVATIVLASGAALVASLFAQAATSLRQSRDDGIASRLASQKLEELLSEPTLTAVSPPTSLAVDTPGFFDRLDEAGRVTSDGVYVRRWLVEHAALVGTTGVRLVVVVRLGDGGAPGPMLVAVRRR